VQKKLKKLLATSLALALTLVLATIFQGTAAFARSNAYDQGYWTARNTYMNGANFNDYCGFQYSDTYCFYYKLGYRAGWTAAQLLH
jgi:hypothetical protein